MRPIYHPERDQITLAGVLYALGDPVRLEIVQLLARKGEQPCRDCGGAIAKSTLSHHFKILREAGVIATQKSGTQHLNSLRTADLNARFPGLLETVLNALSCQSVELT
ncbi:MAG: helix-turn-helix transcriptional regulator [Cyanobacteria bacterium P01_G01_bin.38]